MNIFLRELKANLRSLIIWDVIVILFIVVGFSKFSAYYENPELLAVLDSMPPAMLAAFSLDAFNLTTITGFLGVMFSYFTLLLSVAAAMWGSDIIAKEERDKTVEFSLTLPVTRSRLITAKTLAAVVNCIGLAAITWLATVVSVQQYQPDSEFFNFLFLGVTTVFVLQMVFLAVGVFLGAAMKHYKRASSAAISVLLGTYFLSIVSSLSEDLDFLKYFTPFRYFNPVTLLNESRIELPYLLLSAAIVVVFLAGAYLTYSRRDLYI
jgi:ABC-2 type transport system permease protein